MIYIISKTTIILKGENMFGFFKKKKEEKVSPSSIEGKKPVSKISQKPSGKPSKPRKQVEKGVGEGKVKKKPTQASESQGDDTATPSQKALRQHIKDAQSGIPVSQQEIISAPFLATKTKMMKGDIKIAEITEEDYRDNNLTKKELNIKAWKEYQRRFKIEPYDFKRKNIDNALYVIKKDINNLTKQCAMHIIFKGAKYNPNTQKVKLNFTNSKNLYDFIINNMEVSEIKSPVSKLLMAIEVFNIIKEEKRLKLPENLEKYYRERYNQKVLSLNLHKLHNKTKEELLSSFTDFDNKDRDDETITSEYQEEVSSLHQKENEEQSENPLSKRMSGVSKRIFNTNELTDTPPNNNEIDISKGVMEAIQKEEKDESEDTRQEVKPKTGLELRQEEEQKEQKKSEEYLKTAIEKNKIRDEQEESKKDDFEKFENALDKLVDANKNGEEKVKEENIESNSNKSDEEKKEKKMEMMDFDEEYVQKITSTTEPTSKEEQKEQEEENKLIFTPVADNGIPFIDNKKQKEGAEVEVEQKKEEQFKEEVLEDITKDPIADMGLDIPVFNENKEQGKPNLKDNLTNLKTLLEKKQQENKD